jgi:hypothetical protein
MDPKRVNLRVQLASPDREAALLILQLAEVLLAGIRWHAATRSEEVDLVVQPAAPRGDYALLGLEPRKLRRVLGGTRIHMFDSPTLDGE